jgi:acyl carrier protein
MRSCFYFKALSILAMNLSLPPEAVPLSKSFFELGGNSVSMIAAIVQLQQHSLHIDVDQFSQVQSMRDLIDRVKQVTMIESVELHYKEIKDCMHGFLDIGLGSHQYAVVPLSTLTDGDSTVDLLAESFSRKEPLDVLLGISKSEIIPFARSLYQAAVKVWMLHLHGLKLCPR